jgi:hypothetical protein
MTKKAEPQLVSKKEALELLSEQMRRPNLPANQIIRLTVAYAKLSGWAMRPSQSNFDRTEEPTIDAQVREAERKKKQNTIERQI